MDSNGDKDEATWIGKLAVIPQNGNRSDAVVFDSEDQEVIIVGQGSFKASFIKQIMFNEDGKISLKFTKGLKKQIRNPTMHVKYFKPHAHFDVTFHDNHLNVNWNLQYDNLPEMHGLMGKHKINLYVPQLAMYMLTLCIVKLYCYIFRSIYDKRSRYRQSETNTDLS